MDNQNPLDPQQPAEPWQAPQNDGLYQQPAPSAAQSDHVLTKAEKIKRSFFHVLIGCMIGAAGIAVIAVLVGSFTDVLGRALGTIAMVALHAILSLSYISGVENQQKRDGSQSLELFSNTVFMPIVVSFVTSVFAIWQLLGGELAWKLYVFYFVILFATLHADVLYRIRGFTQRIDTLVYTNYITMAVVVAMLSVAIFVPDTKVLGDFFFRLLAAAGIIDATMTITAAMMHKLHLQKHPELAVSDSSPTASGTPAKPRSFWKNPFVILLLLYPGLQFIGGLIALAFTGFSR